MKVEREYTTADGENFESDNQYWFYDPQLRQIRTTISLRQDGEHLYSFGFKVVPICELRKRRRDAIKDGRNTLKDEITGIKQLMVELSNG